MHFELKEKHGLAYIHLYATMHGGGGGEIIVGNSHASFTLFPKSSMFVKVGNSVPTK